jgi:hypothetical protein|tara:strand:+ start:619 stop:1035 length:417 start_codon:yes stop_codon:yes gene_type:complete
MGITITQFRNAASLQADNLRMDVEINHPDYGWIPYTLDHSDTDTTINNGEVMALIGTDFSAYVAPTQAELDAEAAANVRDERDNILATVVDPMVSNPLRWADLLSDKQAEWSQYRTYLLNVPQQAGFPNTITWPTKPE